MFSGTTPPPPPPPPHNNKTMKGEESRTGAKHTYMYMCTHMCRNCRSIKTR